MDIEAPQASGLFVSILVILVIWFRFLSNLLYP